jgi:hypothetical protein
MFDVHSIQSASLFVLSNALLVILFCANNFSVKSANCAIVNLDNELIFEYKKIVKANVVHKHTIIATIKWVIVISIVFVYKNIKNI